MNIADTKKAIKTMVMYPMALDTFKIIDFTGTKHPCVDWSKDTYDVETSISNVKSAIPKGSEFCEELALLIKCELGISKLAYDYMCTIVGRMLNGIEDYDEFKEMVLFSLNVRARKICSDLKALKKL